MEPVGIKPGVVQMRGTHSRYRLNRFKCAVWTGLKNRARAQIKSNIKAMTETMK